MISNNPWLTRAYEKGEPSEFLFFGGHQPSKNGLISSSCFSQWWAAPFEVAGQQYQTAEHWMMAEKARLFEDVELVDKILKSNTPAVAKKLGRLTRKFDANKWNKHKYDAVGTGNYQKFSQHADLKKYLTDTNKRILVEASPLDWIWGIGMPADHPNIKNPQLWKGENLLGYALMEVRDKLS